MFDIAIKTLVFCLLLTQSALAGELFSSRFFPNNKPAERKPAKNIADKLDGAVEFKGALNIRTQSPIYITRATFTPESAKLLDAGEMSVRISTSWTSAWSMTFETSWNFDMLELTTNFRYAISRDIEIGLDIHGGYIGNSLLGEIIKWYHGLFGMYTTREQIHETDFAYKNLYYSSVDQSFGLSNLQLQMRYQLYADADLNALALTGLIKLPIFEMRGFSSSGVDFGAVISGQFTEHKRILERFTVFGAVGFFKLAQVKVLNFDSATFQFMFWAGLQLRIISLLAANFEMLYLSSPASVISTVFSSDQMELHFGGIITLSKNAVLQVGFLENSISSANTLDFGIHIGIAIKR